MRKQNNTVIFAVPGIFRLFRVNAVFRGVPGCSGVLVFWCSGVPGFSTCLMQCSKFQRSNERSSVAAVV